MVKLEVSILKPNQHTDWDSFVENSPHGTVFHYSDWLKISSKYQNLNFKIFGFFLDDELIGGCPLYFSKMYMLFNNITTLSKTGPFSGFIFNLNQYDQSIQNSFKNEIYNELFKEINIGILDSVKIVNSPTFTDVRYFLWNGWNTTIQYAYFIDLQFYENPMFINRMVKRCIENHITIEESKDIDSFFTLYEATWNRRGYTVPISKNFIKEIFQIFQPNNKIKMVMGFNKTGKIAAANIVLKDPNSVHAWIAATDNELWKTGIHYAMYSHIIHDYKKMGYSSFNIMMANTKNLLTFAHCFNPRLTPYFMVEKNGIINQSLRKIISKNEKTLKHFKIN
jgi:hypothetical protein